MKEIVISAEFSGKKNNVTKIVASALKELNGSGTIKFEPGEYHFFTSGSIKKFFAVSNNSACDKNVAFLIENADNLTIDGCGSVFVFHDLVFPFIISDCKNVLVKNIIFDRAIAPQAVMRIEDKTDDGLKLIIDKEKTPFKVENGAMVFEREYGNVSAKEKILSLHSTNRLHVEYFVASECTESTDKLPVRHARAYATETDYGVYLSYCKNDYCKFCEDGSKYGFLFNNGEIVTCLLDGFRDIDLIFVEKTAGIKFSNITVRRAVGMGIIAQFSRNIEIERFYTDSCYYDSITLSADAMHFVNCEGYIDIHNCKICATSDDAINVHGIYTEIEGITENVLYVRLKHYEQRMVMPYTKDDVVTIINRDSLEEIAKFTVDSAEFCDDSGYLIKLTGYFKEKYAEVEPGFLLELQDKMPNVHIYDNVFDNYPNVRLSGAGDILVENNTFSNCASALIAVDLAKFWYESGRIKNLIFRNNLLDNCNKMGGDAFITLGVDGVMNEACPKIHDKIEISGNIFKNIKNKAICAAGVKELLLKDNKFENYSDDLFCIDKSYFSQKKS